MPPRRCSACCPARPHASGPCKNLRRECRPSPPIRPANRRWRLPASPLALAEAPCRSRRLPEFRLPRSMGGQLRVPGTAPAADLGEGAWRVLSRRGAQTTNVCVCTDRRCCAVYVFGSIHSRFTERRVLIGVRQTLQTSAGGALTSARKPPQSWEIPVRALVRAALDSWGLTAFAGIPGASLPRLPTATV